MEYTDYLRIWLFMTWGAGLGAAVGRAMWDRDSEWRDMFELIAVISGTSALTLFIVWLTLYLG